MEVARFRVAATLFRRLYASLVAARRHPLGL